MEKRTFYIGEALNHIAFITNPDGYDVGHIQRYKEGEGIQVTDEQWQKIVDVIDEALKNATI